MTRCDDAAGRRRTSDLWINGGYFVFRREIFDYIETGEDLVEEPFQRLIEEGKLIAYPVRRLLGADGHAEGQARLETLLESGQAPWRASGSDVESAPAAAGAA